MNTDDRAGDGPCRMGHKRPGHWLWDRTENVWRCAGCNAITQTGYRPPIRRASSWSPASRATESGQLETVPARPGGTQRQGTTTTNGSGLSHGGVG